MRRSTAPRLLKDEDDNCTMPRLIRKEKNHIFVETTSALCEISYSYLVYMRRLNKPKAVLDEGSPLGTISAVQMDFV